MVQYTYLNYDTKGDYDMGFLEGKVAIITGGGRAVLSDGSCGSIGYGIATAYAKEGANLVLTGRNVQKLDDAKEEIERKYGVKVLPVQADVSAGSDNEAVVANVVKQTIDTFGRIDILVNNAGITRDDLLMKLSEEDFDAVIAANLKGTFCMLHFVSRQMLRQRSGKIINLASVVGICGNAGQVNYAASKAGVIGMTKSAAKELASRNITVNAVAPGWIETDMTKNLSNAARERMLSAIPLKKPGTAKQVAGVIAFLASEDADYITGQVLQVDGGMLM